MGTYNYYYKPTYNYYYKSTHNYYYKPTYNYDYKPTYNYYYKSTYDYYYKSTYNRLRGLRGLISAVITGVISTLDLQEGLLDEPVRVVRRGVCWWSAWTCVGLGFRV